MVEVTRDTRELVTWRAGAVTLHTLGWRRGWKELWVPWFQDPEEVEKGRGLGDSPGAKAGQRRWRSLDPISSSIPQQNFHPGPQRGMATGPATLVVMDGASNLIRARWLEEENRSLRPASFILRKDTNSSHGEQPADHPDLSNLSLLFTTIMGSEVRRPPAPDRESAASLAASLLQLLPSLPTVARRPSSQMPFPQTQPSLAP